MKYRRIPIYFFKSTPIPAGAHWITAHPNGAGSKGVPVLVQETKHGAGVFHVIGGAGGKLNYLKLRGLKSPEHYAKESAERARARRAEAQAQQQKDKALGVHAQKQEARADIGIKRRAAEQQFVGHVAGAMGWHDQDLAFDEDAHADLSETARNKARGKHARDLLARAKEAVTLQRKRLLIDADAREQAFSGQTPLHTDDTTVLSVSDLDPVRLDSSLGFNPAYKARAEKAGLTPDAAAAVAKNVMDVGKPALDAKAQAKQDAAAAATAEKKATFADKLKAELAAVNADKPNLAARIVDVQQAIALLKAEKQLKALQHAARAAHKAVDANAEPQAYVLQASEVSDADIEKEVADDLRTFKTRAFLAAVEGKAEPGIDHHVAAGAHNAINALSQIAGGASLVDRSVVDVLGTAGAAQVLARRLRGDLGGAEADRLADRMGTFHLQHYETLSTGALAQVEELHRQAEAFDLGSATGAQDLLVKAELNRKRIAALSDAQKVLGRSLGEMEANAALTVALGEKKREVIQVSLGKTQLTAAINQLHAIGLDQSDYILEKGAGNTFVKINAAGMDKLARPADIDNARRIERNLGIMNGKEDEDGWLPKGFANRADLALHLPPGVADSMASPFAPGADLAQSLKDYIGGRTADGDRAADILSDLQSAAFFDKVGPDRAHAYRAALDAAAPNKGPNGKRMQRAEELEPTFNQYADIYMQQKWGGKRSTLNSQTFDAGDVGQEALHRALSVEPAGVAAYKPIGELTDGDRRALREHFYKNIAKESPEAAGMRADIAKLDDQEPEKSTIDMFGDASANPGWTAWNAARMELAGKLQRSSLTWPDYAKTMRGQANAYAALQDMVRSKVSGEFAKQYNTLHPSAPIKLGKTVIRGNLNHLDAIDPAARDARITAERQLMDSLRERSGGKYTAGSVADKLDAAKESKAAFEQAQMGFFSAEELAQTKSETLPDLAADERHTIGHAAEQKIAAMMGVVGHNFTPGQPVKLFHASMSGKDGVKRQRAIKFALANKRVVFGLGVGSGKTALGLGTMAHLHAEGKIKKALFVVPSIVQGQFGVEALRFLEPGRFNWHCQPGASHEARLASYKDKDTHFHVVTHQSFRDDVLKIAAGQEGGTPDSIAQKLDSMTQPQRKAYIKAALDKEGIAFDYAMADEGHGLLNRDGKDNSRMSNAVQAVTDNAEYYIHASGDPVKNDASEAFDLLAKMDSARYNDRGAFMRRYGGDTVYAKDGLRRELARHAYTAALAPDVRVTRHQRNVELTPGQKASLDAVDRHVAAARIARIQGKVNVPALQALSPESFAGADPSTHEAIGQKLTAALGVIHESATGRVINAHAQSGKLDAVSSIATEHKGKPGVVFARSLAAVDQIKTRLESEGHRVILITGKDSSQAKAEKIRAFNPDSGDRQADIIICSDAGAVGANLQSGHWLAQYDCPMTAMTHAQRNGRINRIGQQNDIDLYDLVANHTSERKARERLTRKYALREVVTSPLDGMDDTGLAPFLHHQNTTQAHASMF